MSMIPVATGNRGAAVLPYFQVGGQDPTVTPTPGSPGMIFVRIPQDGMPPTAIGVYMKITDEGENTNWQLLSGGGAGSITDFKDAVDTISVADITLAAPGAVINGVVMAAGYSFLAKDQTLPEENGIYDWNGAAVPATRRADANTDAEVTHGLFTWVDGNPGNEPTANDLTGWILSTSNPIVLDTTGLTFAEIPLPAGATTAIDGLYFVAANGNDANNGSIAAPFLTIQGAITAAVADGHTFANPAEILVLPKTGTYAGFTAVSGINIKGLNADNYGVRISGKVLYVPNASGIAVNAVEISNLQIANGADHTIEFSSANVGQLRLNNCRVINTNPAFNCEFISSPGSLTTHDGGFLAHTTGDAVVVAAGNYALTRIISTVPGPVAASSAILVSGGAAASIKECTIVTTNAVDPSVNADGLGSFLSIINSTIINSSAGAAAAISATNGANVQADNAITVVSGAGLNYAIDALSSMDKSNVSFVGTSSAVSTLGIINLINNSEEWFVETRIVTAPEAAAEQLVLTRMPLRISGDINTANLELSLLGVDQYFGADYTLVGDGSTVDWTGLGMSIIPVAAGDTIGIGYWASRKT